jgi:hypothetical protein
MQSTNNRFYAMLTTQFRGATTVLLCALLLQNCQSQLNAIEEESPAAALPQSGWQPPASETLTQPLGYPPSSPLTVAVHQPKVLFKAFAGISPSAGIRPTASTTRSRNLLTQDFSSGFTTASGEHVKFSQIDDQWSATLQADYGVSTLQRTLSVVGPANIGSFLSWLHRQDIWTSRAHIHVLDTSQYSPCVYLGKAGLWGGMPSDEEEDSRLPARRQSSSPDDELAQCRKKVRHGEEQEPERIRRETLNTLLAIAGSELDKASAFLEVLLVAVKDKHCRQKALKALGRVSQAAPDWISECLPSLRAATRSEDRDVRLLALKTLGEAEWKYYFGDVGSAPDLPSDMATILDSPCPFWPDQLVKDTHLLVLIPATVGGVPFTLNQLGELIKHPSNGGHSTNYRHYNDLVKAQIGEESPPRSYWLLMTRDVLPGSRNKTHRAQQEMVASYASQGYALPRGLEAATAILMHHVREGEQLFGDDPWTYTRCQEVVHGSPSVVGGFGSSGLSVYYFHYDHYCCGVSCCRQF